MFRRSSYCEARTKVQHVHFGTAAGVCARRRGFYFSVKVAAGCFGFRAYEVVARHAAVRAQEVAEASGGRSGYGLPYSSERAQLDYRARGIISHAPVTFTDRDFIQSMTANKSLQPMPVGRLSSAFAVDITAPAWLSSGR